MKGLASGILARRRDKTQSLEVLKRERALHAGSALFLCKESSTADRRKSIVIWIEMAVSAVHELMRFSPQLQSELETEVTFIERAFVALARLDAYLLTFVTCFNCDATDNADAHRQNLCDDTLASFLSKA